MWQKLSIRSQLTLLMLLLLTIVEIATLSLINWLDIKERQTLSIEQAQTLSRSLNNDLLKALLNNRADILSDISFRIEGFKSVDALQVYNQNNQAVFLYGKKKFLDNRAEKLRVDAPYFDSDGRLFIKTLISAETTTFGESIIVINPEQYNTRRKENFVTLLWIFPIEVFIGFIIAWRISLYYTKPFEILANAIQHNDIENNVFNQVKTIAKNEIGMLFSGYNQMISKIIKTTKVLRFQSSHDSLTGLFNRYAIEKEIETALKDSNSNSNIILNLDLDQFKNVNDSVGHMAGDELLQLVSHHLKSNLPESAKIARIGGDDFLILLTNTSKDTAIPLTEKLLQEFSDFRFVWNGETLSTSATICLVNFKPHEYTLTELFKTIDVDFYIAKSKGHNKLHIHEVNQKDNDLVNIEIHISNYIKEALKDGPSRFELYAQDIVPLQIETDKISYEILLRMWNSNNEFLPPDQFLPTAERYQLMVDIDIFVLTNYLNIIKTHRHHLDKLHSVHINLAGGTLNHPDFQSCVKELISTIDFPWHCLELEVTETSSIGNLVQAQEFIQYCKQHGIGFALDDFGTGMSSFEYLKNLPFDIVKIDGSFVRDMLIDPVDNAMIRYTHEISKLRNQETVAEYVETQADVDELRRIGITYGQGYFLGKPRPLTDWI